MKENYTEIMFILDRSGSMSNMVEYTISGFNEFIEKQKQIDGECKVSLILFDDEYEEIYLSKNIYEVEKLTTAIYIPRGWTALNDAIAKGIKDLGVKLRKMSQHKRPSKVIVVVITDGQENRSKTYGGVEGTQKIKDIIKHQEEKYNWNVILMGCSDLGLEQMAQTYNISSNHTYTFVRGAMGPQGPSGAIGVSLSDAVASYRIGKCDTVAFNATGTEDEEWTSSNQI